MKQQQVEFKAKGYLTVFLVVSNTLYVILNNEIIETHHCKNHTEAENKRITRVNEFWGFKLN